MSTNTTLVCISVHLFVWTAKSTN